MNGNNRILVAVDSSNLEYLIINSSVRDWNRFYPDDASVLKRPTETDQDNLPNILNIDSYRRVLHNKAQIKLEGVEHLLKDLHQGDIDASDGIDIFLTKDDHVSGNFRRKLYPQYKAQRKLQKKSYDTNAIMSYIDGVIFKELDIENTLGYKIIKVDDCESDDIISVLMTRFGDYSMKILFSSDTDFLQLENVMQYDFAGRKVHFKIQNHEDYSLNSREYLYWKILKGDSTDNIKNVFERCGEVGSYKLVKDKQRLRNMLMESEECAERFNLNKKLIDFREIPNEVVERIYDTIVEKLKVKSERDKIEEFSLENCMRI